MGEISTLTEMKFNWPNLVQLVSSLWVVLPTWRIFLSLLYKNLHLAQEKQDKRETILKGINSKSLEPVKFLGYGRTTQTQTQRGCQNSVVTRRKCEIVIDLMKI